MCLAQWPQRSDAGEARTRGPSVSSQALYHWATALPIELVRMTPDVLHEFLEYEDYLEGIDTIYIYVQEKTSGVMRRSRKFCRRGGPTLTLFF